MQGHIEIKQLRSFGLLVGGIFALLGLWPAVVRGEDFRLWALVLAGLLIVSGLLFPSRLRQVYRMWMALGQALGWLNTRVLLSVVFYGLITPMGLIMRLAGKDPMRRSFEPDAGTYRVLSTPRPGSHMRRQF
jgi:hypothetical protein